MKNDLLTTRITGKGIIEVSKANPNGDPNDDNNPRTLSDGRGWISPVSMKRKARNIFVDHDDLFFKELCKIEKLNPEEFWILESKQRGFGDDITPPQAVKMFVDLCKKSVEEVKRKYWDLRTMGTTFLQNDSKDKDNKFRFVKTGPLTISAAISVAPIEIVTATISKMAPQDLNEDANEQTLGTMQFVDHGIYCFDFEINPNVARHTGMTNTDLRVLKRILPYIFEYNISCARPTNSIRFLNLWWKEHSSLLKSFNTNEFSRALQPQLREGVETPRSIDDYIFPENTVGAEDLMEGLHF